MDPDRHLLLVDRVTAAFADEIDRHDGSAPVPWPWWPDARALVGHLGGIHAWAAEVVRTGEPVADPEDLPAPVGRARTWYLDRREELLAALRDAAPDAPCWAFTGDDRTAAFWRRRMVFETAKHLMDLRASGGRPWRVADELAAQDYADGIDELLGVFLARSRPTLAPLPAPVVLESTDGPRRWCITSDWRIGDSAGDGAARIRARTGDLALVVWQRADPLGDRDRFQVEGPVEAVRAFRDARIHP